MINERFLNAKRKLFDKVFDFLNPQQREAVYSVNGPLLILAGAGSGKTTVLVNRIGYMIRYGNSYKSDFVPENLTENDVEELEKAITLPNEDIANILDKYAVDKVKPWSILSITFTNKAANEMKERLTKKVGETDALDIWAGTFHSVCLRLLRRYGDRIGYDRSFTIYDTDDQKKIMNAIIKDTKTDDKMFTPKAVINYISRAKDKLISPKECEKIAKDFRETKMAELYNEYQTRLFKSNAMDFDDIIVQTVKLLQTDDEVLSYCQNRFKYVCVDEYQDTNHAQFVLTALISDKRKNIMVVGDDDQSIYRFRGADIENILNFDKEIENTKVIKLEQNYRSTKSILDTANAIISKNENRHGKSLWTDKDKGSKVALRRLDDNRAEARYIVDTIIKIKKDENRSLNDFAVLYRINAMSNNLESAFSRMGIPYRVLGGLRFYERKEVKDILAYLSVINNPSDNLRLKRIINEPKRKIGESTVNAVEKLGEHYGLPMFAIMENAEDYNAFSKPVALKLKQFTSMIRGIRELSESEPLDVVIDKTLDLTGYRMMLALSNESDSETRLQNVNEIVSNAVEFMSTHEDAKLSDFLEEVALVADIDNYDPDAEAVVMMTVHSAKGLEFPIVFLPGMEESIFPSQQSIYEEEELEEERRLAYVAVTRAKERLFITHAKERLVFGKTLYNKVSRFVSEIPDSLLDKEDDSETMTRAAYEYKKMNKPKPKISDELFKTPLSTGFAPKKTANREVFDVGDAVDHPMFGTGIILSSKPMGPDTLYEIAFEDFGTKKLMGTYAKIKKHTDN